MKRSLGVLGFAVLVGAWCWGQTNPASAGSSGSTAIYLANANGTVDGSAAADVRNENPKLTVSVSPAANSMPSTLTVSTAALLELHGIRKSAVDLCLDLPTKYRTRKPCADIFTREVRLNNLRKNKQ